MIGKTPFDFMPAEEASRFRALFNEIISQKKQIVDLENWNITKEGSEICLLTNGGPFFDEEGNLIGYNNINSINTGQTGSFNYLFRVG